MKMNTLKTLLLVIFISISLGSCEKFLEAEPENQYTSDRVLNDPAFAEGILLRAYKLLPVDYTQDEVATDNAVSSNKNNAFLRMATGEWSAIYNPLSVWESSYDAIFNINYFLSIVDDVVWSWESQNRRQLFANRFKGEALALRAYFHLRLLINHGGVSTDGSLLGIPLVTDIIQTSDNWKLSRNKFSDCVDQITSDFNEALALLPYKWEDSPGNVDYTKVFGVQNNNRIQGQIVDALKAKFSLYAASPAYNNGVYGTDKCVESAVTAGDLISKIGGISGLDPQGHIFYDKDNDATMPEILWRNDYITNNIREIQNFPPSKFGNGTVNPTQNLVDAFPMVNGYPIDAGESGYNSDTPYQNRDPRLQAYILYDGNKLGTKEINTDVNDLIDGLNKTNVSTRTGYYQLKLLRSDVNLDPTVNSTRRHFYSHIRFTEVFLIYAEAANEAWGPDLDPNGYGFTARDVIAAIRTRAGIDADDPYLASITTKEGLRGLIYNERRLELCFEGFRFWDIRRWKLDISEKAKGIKIDGNSFEPFEVESRRYESHMYYGPIPNTEITKYDGLLQNQGW
jgi:hypothetical protein